MRTKNGLPDVLPPIGLSKVALHDENRPGPLTVNRL